MSILKTSLAEVESYEVLTFIAWCDFQMLTTVWTFGAFKDEKGDCFQTIVVT